MSTNETSKTAAFAPKNGVIMHIGKVTGWYKQKLNKGVYNSQIFYEKRRLLQNIVTFGANVFESISFLYVSTFEG